MRFLHTVSALLGTQAVSTAALRHRASDDTTTTGSGVVIGNYIVEFDESESASSFYAALEAKGVQIEVRTEFKSRIFNGASFQVRNASAGHDGAGFLRELEAAPQVRTAWPVRSIGLSTPEYSAPPADNAGGSSSSSARVRRQVEPRDAANETDTFSTHVMTQVDKLRAEGITGKGVRVAIVDSGVDYTHPALGGCFGSGCLVEAGWDFTGDDFLPGTNEAQPDADPMDNCQGHGTHVAGTVAAQLKGNEYGFTGAAPGVKIAAYRAWGCRATSTNEILLAAFLRAFEEGADIISCSDGDPSGWSGDAWSLVASRIVDAGVPVVISAGNDGGMGLFYASTPAGGRGVTGAGAVTNTKFPTLLSAATYTSANDTEEFGFLRGLPEISQNVTISVWSAADANNACSALPDDTPDLSKNLILLESVDARATGCYPQDQGANVVAKGGKYLMYYAKDNLTMRDEIYNYAEGLQGVGSVPPYVAERWMSFLGKSQAVTVSLPGVNSSTVRLEQLENTISGGYAADLTSWGPTWELNTSTSVSAPGANILSTFPVALGGYRVMSGTSMSAPIIAGIYALLGEARGTLDPKSLRKLIMTTAKPLEWFDGKTVDSNFLAPVPQQGAGIIQAYAAAHATTELSVDSIAFNDTDHFAGKQTFSVKNSGSSEVVFDISTRKAPTMYTMLDNTSPLFAASWPNPTVDQSAEISFSSSKITVPAGGSVDVTVTCTPPANVNATRLPVYSGHIFLKSTGETHVVPYLGVVGSMYSTPVLVESNVYLAEYNGAVTANKTYTISRPDPANPPRTDRGDESKTPNVLIRPTVGTSSLRVEVLRGDVKGESLGALAGWPLPYVSRVAQRAFVNGLLADGTVLEEGVYALKVSALRIFGNQTVEADWDIFTTVSFNLKYSS